MGYHKIGQTVETKSGLKGSIVNLNYRDGKVESMTVSAEGSENYYKGERVQVLASNIKTNGN